MNVNVGRFCWIVLTMCSDLRLFRPDLASFSAVNKRVKGIEPSCAAWEAAVLPLNYTRRMISDFRFAIADCNRNKFAPQIAVACAVLSAVKIDHQHLSGEDSGRYRTGATEGANNHCQEITSSDAVKSVP
jgi:hypothetical protein